jgi:hypothetical protein
MELVSKVPALIESRFSRSFLNSNTLSLRCVGTVCTVKSRVHEKMIPKTCYNIITLADMMHWTHVPDDSQHVRNCSGKRKTAFHVQSHSKLEQRYIVSGVTQNKPSAMAGRLAYFG